MPPPPPHLPTGRSLFPLFTETVPPRRHRQRPDEPFLSTQLLLPPRGGRSSGNGPPWILNTIRLTMPSSRLAVIGGGDDGNQRPPSQGRGSPRQQVASLSGAESGFMGGGAPGRGTALRPILPNRTIPEPSLRPAPSQGSVDTTGGGTSQGGMSIPAPSWRIHM